MSIHYEIHFAKGKAARGARAAQKPKRDKRAPGIPKDGKGTRR